jgi:copper chaperone CopZ
LIRSFEIQGNQMATLELEVHGMTCGSCVKHVTKALQSVPEVTHVDVDLASGRAREGGDLQADCAPLIAALVSEDYQASLAAGVSTAQPAKSAGCHTNQGSKGGCCCG